MPADASTYPDISTLRMPPMHQHEKAVWKLILDGEPMKDAVGPLMADRAIETIYAKDGMGELPLVGYAIGPAPRTTKYCLYYANMCGPATGISAVFGRLVSKRTQANTVYGLFRNYATSPYSRYLQAPDEGYTRVMRSAGQTTPHTSAILHSKEESFFTIVDPEAIWLPVEVFPNLRIHLLVHRHFGAVATKMVAAATKVTSTPILQEWGPAILQHLWMTGGVTRSALTTYQTGGDCLGAYSVPAAPATWVRILEALYEQQAITL